MSSGGRGSRTDDADFQLALLLQNEMNASNSPPPSSSFADPIASRRPTKRAATDDPLNATQNLVHPEWETRDPTPDIQALFTAFDGKFFQSKLRCVQLEWSRRMYQCAGICYYRRNGQGHTAITIRLSEPLLKLRQRKDLIETLLHEMIHAYLFVLNIRESNGGHGPNFKRIMVSINKTAGTNITVYHTFHDEVNVYRSHVWKCNGLCQHRQPFYGIVRRTCNRAPGPNDQWWPQHQQTCGGYFQKISEPEKKPTKAAMAGKKTKAVAGATIRGLNDANNVRQRIDDPKWGMAAPAVPKIAGRPAAKAASSVRTVTKAPTTATSVQPTSAKPRAAPIGGNLRNVIGFKDLNDSDSDAAPVDRPRTSFAGAGNTLGSAPSRASSAGGSAAGRSTNGAQVVAVIDLVRDVWSRKFDNVRVPKPMVLDSVKETPKKTEYNVTPSSSQWQTIGNDNDVLVNDVKDSVIELNSDSDSDDDMFREPATRQRPPALTQDQRQRAIKKEINSDANTGDDDADDAEDDDDDDIVLIDDEFDDTLANVADRASAAGDNLDTSVIDDIFGTDTLLSDFANINDAMPGPAVDQIIQCPICAERMRRAELSEHLNGCLGTRQVVERPRKRAREDAGAAGRGRPRSTVGRATPSSARRQPRASIATTPRLPPVEPVARQPVAEPAETVSCPSCWQQFAMAELNQHLDTCLT